MDSRIELEGIPETLLITVRARAEETVRPDSLLQDPYAVNILKKSVWGESSKNKVASSSQIGVVIRTKIFDRIVKTFLSNRPEGIIVALGCGLDARHERLKLPCSCWYDLDVPESIEIRKRFFQEKERYKMIAKSMLDYSWMEEIPKDKPILIITEGVFMYFSETELKPLLSEIFRVFPHAEMVFDAIPPFLAKRTQFHSEVRKYNAPFRWGLDKAEDLKLWDNRIEIIRSDYYFDYYPNRWPLSMRLIRLVPKFRRGNKVVHIKYRH